MDNLGNTIGAFARQIGGDISQLPSDIGNLVGQIPSAIGSAYKWATNPITPSWAQPYQQTAGKRPMNIGAGPLGLLAPSLTPKMLMNATVPGANAISSWASQGTPLVNGGLNPRQMLMNTQPITQVPSMVQSFIRQAGRYAGLQPSPLDIAMLPGYAKMAGAALGGAAPTIATPKPDYIQKSFTQAWNEGDIDKLQEIYDSTPKTHPFYGDMTEGMDMLSGKNPGQPIGDMGNYPTGGIMGGQEGAIDYNQPIAPNETTPDVEARRAQILARLQQPNGLYNAVTEIQKQPGALDELNKAMAIEKATLKSIDPEDFNAYLTVQRSGVTNMFDVKTVGELSGLPKDKILTIMKNYGKLQDMFNAGGEEGSISPFLNTPPAGLTSPDMLQQLKTMAMVREMSPDQVGQATMQTPMMQPQVTNPFIQAIRPALGVAGLGAAPFIGNMLGKKIGEFIDKFGGQSQATQPPIGWNIPPVFGNMQPVQAPQQIPTATVQSMMRPQGLKSLLPRMQAAFAKKVGGK